MENSYSKNAITRTKRLAGDSLTRDGHIVCIPSRTKAAACSLVPADSCITVVRIAALLVVLLCVHVT